MLTHEQVVETLRFKGHRLTPQRIIVLSIISAGDGHMGVDEVFRRAKEAYPYMDIATVYRTLHLFKELGVVTEVAIGERLHYELTERWATPVRPINVFFVFDSDSQKEVAHHHTVGCLSNKK